MHKFQTSFFGLSCRKKRKPCNLSKGISIFENGDGVPPQNRLKNLFCKLPIEIADDSYFNLHLVPKNVRTRVFLCTNSYLIYVEEDFCCPKAN